MQYDESVLLKQIQDKKNKYNKLFDNKKSKEELYKWLKSELAYTSNNIEGNTLTRKETRLVIENNITSSSKPFSHYQEAINHAKAFEYIIDIAKSDKLINKNIVLDIHKKLLSGIDDYNAGFYRNCSVRISGSRVILPNPLKVHDLMNELYNKLKKIKDVKDIINMHLNFVSIHPFSDGNGRCARLLMNLLLMQKGFCPIIIRPRDRKSYINSIEKSQLSGDNSDNMNFMLKRLNLSFDSIIDVFDPTKEIPNGTLLTISKLAKEANVPISTIRYLVRVEKLKPIMYTESGYMMFSKEQAKEVIKIVRKKR